MHKLQCIALLLGTLALNLSVFGQEESKTWDLQQCISYALENNISVSQSKLKQKTSELEYKQSKLERLPSINGSVSQSLLDPTTTSFGLNASMNLFNGLSTEYAIKKNKLEVDQQTIQTNQAKYEIEVAVTEAYLQALYYKDNITVQEKVLESSAEELKLAEAKYKVGSIALKDYSDIEAQYANNEYSLIRSQNQYLQQKLTLKQLLELAPGETFDIVVPEIESANYDVPTPMDVYNEACSVLPEIKNVEQQRAIDSLSVKIAQSSYYPSLSLSAGIGASANFFDNESELEGNKSLRLALNVPIFNKWQTKTNVETMKINAEYNALTIESTKKNLYKEIEAACQSAEAYQKELDALEKSEIAAKNSYELAQKQFKVGATDATSLLLAETNYIEASLSKLQAKYMAVLYYQLLQHYQGKPISL